MDTFGHSATNAKLVHQLGYRSIFFARIDQQEKDWLNSNQQMEFKW
jgi:hypothetical protein